MSLPARFRERDLRAGSAAHYLDPPYYTDTYRDRTDDVEYYVALAAGLGGPVLEYGCGNGRILLPLARAGLEVTGVDASRPMVDDLRRRLKQEPRDVARRVRARRGDMRGLRLKGRFRLVLSTFNTFLHLYTRRDVERHLRRVRAHLAPRGRFVVDVSMPDPEELSRDPTRRYHMPRFRHAGTGQVVGYAERFDYDALSQVLLVDMCFDPRPRRARSPGRVPSSAAWSTPLTHRQFFPQELEALLHYNGLSVREVHADYTRSPPTSEAGTLLYHCTARR